MMKSSRHLDLGCGLKPNNPYNRAEVFALDIGGDPHQCAGLSTDHFQYANLSVQPIPFPDNYFSSVSAYDFLEHIPRVLACPEKGTILPFINLMNEVWRVLEPGGLFYAVTPAFPRREAFVDPTHVNFITDNTHRYFTDPGPGASLYGFTGRFRSLRVMWTRKRYAYEPVAPSLYHRLRRLVDVLKRRRAHLLWELEAIKPR